MWKCLSSAHNLFPQQVIKKKNKDSIDNKIKKISAQWLIITYLGNKSLATQFVSQHIEISKL